MPRRGNEFVTRNFSTGCKLFNKPVRNAADVLPFSRVARDDRTSSPAIAVRRQSERSTPVTHRRAAVLPIARGRPQSNFGAFAEQLRQSREQRKLSLQQIADSTRIGISQLQALERGDVNLLPEGIYRRSIIRQYANA